MRSLSTVVLFVGTLLLTFSVLAIGLLAASAPPSSAGPRPSASASFAPLRTPAAGASPRASTQPGETHVYVVDGNDFVGSSVPEHALLTRSDAGAVLETTRNAEDALFVTYDLVGRLPADAVVHGVAVRICGTGEGDFWEVYGPLGAEPFEYEVTQPSADGCWHFSEGSGGDMTVIAATMLASRMVVHSVEYSVTFAR